MDTLYHINAVLATPFLKKIDFFLRFSGKTLLLCRKNILLPAVSAARDGTVQSFRASIVFLYYSNIFLFSSPWIFSFYPPKNLLFIPLDFLFSSP